jgi:hypothetical protein
VFHLTGPPDPAPKPADIITRLLPILQVGDPHAERDFYLRLGIGLRTTCECAEYPDFLAVGNDAVEFGPVAGRTPTRPRPG